VGNYSGTWHNTAFNQNGTLDLVITSYSSSTLTGWVNDHEGEGNLPFSSGYISGTHFQAFIDINLTGQHMSMNGTFSANGLTLSGNYSSTPSLEYGYGTYTVTK